MIIELENDILVSMPNLASQKSFIKRRLRITFSKGRKSVTYKRHWKKMMILYLFFLTKK